MIPLYVVLSKIYPSYCHTFLNLEVVGILKSFFALLSFWLIQFSNLMSAAKPTGPITRASKSVDRSFLNYMKFANLMILTL